ncbi:MAG: allantoicase, partial [Saprospiraceae bacterium]|nr:allantoicase [Saprospiraceae bacterium]
MTDLAAERFGGEVLNCSDDFFAEKENLLKAGRGIFIPDKYTERGKWMDGWESRRKRVAGHDWCTIKLGAEGIIYGVDIDTNHFLGNHPPFASIEACHQDDLDALAAFHDPVIMWTEILPKSPLQPGSQNFYTIENREKWTHLKLNIYPDGGVARLKVYGKVTKDWSTVLENEIIDLAAATNGGQAIACNDEFFSHKENINMPHRGVNMGDGWETKRNRTPGNRDWLILRLARKGHIQKII